MFLCCDPRSVELYDMLRERARSLVVDVDRALAVASPAGPAQTKACRA
jgi:predicted RNA polymerase sigma factor